MSLGTMKEGKFGQYYEYIDPNTKQVNRISVKSKYITNALLDEMIYGKTVQFERKSIFGIDIVQAKLIPITAKDGRETLVIHTDVVDSKDDRIIIQENKLKFITDCFTGPVPNRQSVEAVLRDIPLIKDCWKVYTECTKSVLPVEQQTDNFIYDALIIYRDYTTSTGIYDEEFWALAIFYKNEPNGNRLVEITQEDYMRAKLKFKDESIKVENQQSEAINLLKQIRINLYNQIKENIIIDELESIDLNEVLQKDVYEQIQPIIENSKLTKNDTIIKLLNLYTNVTNSNELNYKLLVALKLYYSLNNINNENVSLIGKFIIENNIKQYYNSIMIYPELNDLIINSTDKLLIKQYILSNLNINTIEALKDKPEYFERTIRLKSELIDRLNIDEVLDNLKEIIPDYNQSAQNLLLLDIRLNSDLSFTYQFYNCSDETDTDGRSIAYITKLYNKIHQDSIYFDYNE